MGKHFRSPSQATTSSMASFAGMTKAEKCRFNARKRCKAFGHFLYNKDNKTFCHRTCKNWFLILAFYIVFLVILVGSFMASLYGIMIYIKSSWTEPYLDKKELIPNGSPGVSILPRLAATTAPIIWYTHSGTNTPSNIRPETYVKFLDDFFKAYEIKNNSMYVDCGIQVKKEGEICRFAKEDLGPCGKEGYGYYDDKPCIYIKLNKLKGWAPKLAEPATDKNKPSKQMIWANCQGATRFDSDHIEKISFYPQSGFMEYFFPFDGSKGYLSPLVGIQLEKISPGFVIGIKCSIWGRDVKTESSALNSANAFIYIDIKKE